MQRPPGPALNIRRRPGLEVADASMWYTPISSLRQNGTVLRMREPPRVAEESIRLALNTEYRISVSSLNFLPLGADSASFVYRVRATDGTSYFLKLRACKGFSVQSLAIPRHLCDRGMPNVFAPLPTVAGALWVGVGDFALALYPFIEGRSGADGGLSVRQWQEYGVLMRQINSLQLPPDLSRIVPHEMFAPSRRGVIDDLEAAIGRGAFSTRWSGSSP